ncbi:RNA-binding protein 48 [Plutella xylostella]|uniref:RNA-binding protein 48 n=1 Tax=Plutella xylostella TaxID=51655 RepID=UPI002032F8B6|nr:RNA-binding protein 48 [Plutella xylostella]
MESQSVPGILLPHHEQQELCSTRLPYRQGRKLTAVKTYTINDESRHILVFGVPSLNLRQETKALFSKFGKVLQVNLSMEHKSEIFTETYHVVYEKISHARIAKKMLDTKSFYGGVLHVCYAPEYETIGDTRTKLMLRRRDVLLRLKNLEKEETTKGEVKKTDENPVKTVEETVKMNMGEFNVIGVSRQIRDVVFDKNLKRKIHKRNEEVVRKQYKPCFIEKGPMIQSTSNVEIVDITSTKQEIVTNVDIDKTLNYNTFGKELIKKLPEKPMNSIQYHTVNKKS